jgi:hypothetical protein
MEALSIWTRKMVSWRVISSLAICIVLEKRRFAIMEKCFGSQRGDTKFTFHDAENLQLNLPTFELILKT